MKHKLAVDSYKQKAIDLSKEKKELLETLIELYSSCNAGSVVKNYLRNEFYVGSCGIPSDKAIHKAKDLIDRMS